MRGEIQDQEMTRDEAALKIREVGVIPIVRAASAKHAVQAAEAVCAGGIPIVEITMTVPGAIDLIAQLAKTLGNEILIGAGTILDPETAQRCIDAGAEFIVSPGFDRDTVEYVKRLGKLMAAGALTPTEVVNAWKAGSDFVKIFPCGSVGGARYIKALKAPLPQIPMIPTEIARKGPALLARPEQCYTPALPSSNDARRSDELGQQVVEIVSN